MFSISTALNEKYNKITYNCTSIQRYLNCSVPLYVEGKAYSMLVNRISSVFSLLKNKVRNL